MGVLCIVEGKRKQKNGKELSSGVKIIAVRLTNNTDNTHAIGRDIAFFSGLREITPLNPLIVKDLVKQSVIGYLPYFLPAFGSSNITINGKLVSSFPFGLILWPGIAKGNMLVAGGANSNLLKELKEYDIMDKDIKPGETIYGIIGVQDVSYIPLTIRKR